MHLTTTHFRDRIIRRINPPFKCLMCDYSPPSSLSNTEKTEDLLMHYGTTERISVKFYEDACRELLHAESENPPEHEPQKSIECNICDLLLVGERTLLKHLTLRHFPKILCDDLPKKIPFRCPFIDCHQTRQNLHSLMLHYGVDHNVSMELYQKVKKPGPGSSSSGSSAKVELPDTPRFAKLQAVVTPYHPESDEKTTQFRVPSPGSEISPEPTGSSIHRFRKSWGSGNELQRIEELQERIKQMESAHKEKLKEKQSEFERWLVGKESRLEEEVNKNKGLQEKLVEAEKSVMELTAQLEMVHDNFSRVEAEFDKKNKLYEELLGIKELADKELEEKENERINSYEELYIKEKEAEALQEKLRETTEELNAARNSETSEKDKCSALQQELDILKTDKTSLQKELQKKNKELEKKNKDLLKKDEELNRFGQDSPGIKMKITKEKGSLRSTKIQVNPELEALVKERDAISEVLVKVQSATETEISLLKKKTEAQLKEINRFKSDQVHLKDLEKEKKELLKKIKVLESTLSNWETRQFTNVKLISGLEKERDTLQQKLKEMKDGNLSHEDQLYWKDVAIKNGEKEIKTLKAEQEERDEKIQHLTKELAEARTSLVTAERRVEDLEKQVDSSKDRAGKEKIEEMQRDIVNKNNEIKHLKITLSQRVQDLSRINQSAAGQKAELARLKKENEKFETDYSQVITQLETYKNVSKDLEYKIVIKNKEIRELKDQCWKSNKDDKVGTERQSILQAKVKEENRVEMLMMNQVLSDMDTVIKLREQGASPEKGKS